MGEWSPRAVCCHVNGGEAWARPRHRAFAEWFCVYPQRVFINTTTAPSRIYIHLLCIYTFVSSDNWLVLYIYIPQQRQVDLSSQQYSGTHAILLLLLLLLHTHSLSRLSFFSFSVISNWIEKKHSLLFPYLFPEKAAFFVAVAVAVYYEGLIAIGCFERIGKALISHLVCILFSFLELFLHSVCDCVFLTEYCVFCMWVLGSTSFPIERCDFLSFFRGGLLFC